MVCDYLKQRFPGTEFEFINAGIPSTGSTPGAMRLVRDVLSKGMIDLLFEEAAVNDATNGISPKMQLRGMEGIVYHAIKSNPNMDIVERFSLTTGVLQSPESLCIFAQSYVVGFTVVTDYIFFG